MNGSRQRYRLDDYLQDKAQRAASPLSRGGSSGIRVGTAVTPVGNTSVQTVKSLPVRPPHTVQRPSGSSYNASSASGGQNIKVDVTTNGGGTSAGGGVLTQSQMTTAYTKQLLENALQGLLDMQNRKFKYDARSSPLYTIVQRQAEENARLASGRAYAQAKGAAGGYGSSYATLAADEAGRQAMRELDDQQLALYQAAREEFEAENASMLDWYNTARQLHADAEAMEKAEAEKAKAEASGLNDATANLLLTATENGWYNGTNKEALRAKLETYAAVDPTIDVDAVMKRLTGEQSAVIADKVAGFEQNPTAEGAAQIMADAKNHGTWEQVQPQVSAGLSETYLGALDNLASGYIALGVDQATWDAMTDEDKAAAVLAEAEKAYKEGYMTRENYAGVMLADAKNAVLGIWESDKRAGKKKDDFLLVASGVLDSVDNGTMDQKTANEIMEYLATTPLWFDIWKNASNIERDDKGYITKVRVGGSKSEREAYLELYRATDRNREKELKKGSRGTGRSN